MSAHPDPATDRADRYRDLLDGFLDLAVELRELVRAQVQAETDALAQPAEHPDTPLPSAIPGLIAAYDRLTRAVRRTVLLCQALDHPPRLRAAPPDPVAARKRILRDVENKIGANARSDAAEPLRAELLERLEDPDLDDDLLARPLADIVTDICRDLGVITCWGQPDFLRRTPDDIRRLCADAVATASTAANDPRPTRATPHRAAASCTPPIPSPPGRGSG